MSIQKFWNDFVTKIGEFIVSLIVLCLVCAVLYTLGSIVEGFQKTLWLVMESFAKVVGSIVSASGTRPVLGPLWILIVAFAMFWLLSDFVKWILEGCPSEAFTGDTTNPLHSDYAHYSKRNAKVVEAYVEEGMDFKAIAAKLHMSPANVRRVLTKSGVNLRKSRAVRLERDAED